MYGNVVVSYSFVAITGITVACGFPLFSDYEYTQAHVVYTLFYTKPYKYIYVLTHANVFVMYRPHPNTH